MRVMDGDRCLVGEGFQTFGMNGSEKSDCRAVQESKANHLTMQGDRRTDIRTQPFSRGQPLPTHIRERIVNDHSLPALKHLPQVVRFSQWKPDPHDFSMKTMFIVTVRADHACRIS